MSLPELPPEAVAFLDGMPEEELMPFLWNWLRCGDPRIPRMVDDMLLAGVPPEDLLVHGPYQEIPLAFRQCLTRMALWRKASILEKGKGER